MGVLKPFVIVIDDLFGRDVPSGPNRERGSFCRKFRLEDISPNRDPRPSPPDTVARALFYRGQRPAASPCGTGVCNDLDGLLSQVKKHCGQSAADPCALVLLDLCFYTGIVTPDSEHLRGEGMPDGSPGDDDPKSFFGFEVLRALRRELPYLPVAILSSMPEDAAVTEAFNRHGALAFLGKNDLEASNRLAAIINRHGLFPDPSGTILGTSTALLLALRDARRIAAGSGHVLLRGEPGTGKELFGQYIHHHSARRSGPYVSHSLPAVPDTLADDLLFGHVRGYPDSSALARNGLFRDAHAGSLLLDEVGKASSATQAKLLRVLSSGEVYPLGASAVSRIDTRVLAATNDDLEARVAQGTFMPDLLDRIMGGGTLRLPPLRDRLADIPVLVGGLLNTVIAEFGARQRDVHAETLALLAAQPWPGNIRQLIGALREAVSAHPDNTVLLPGHFQRFGDRTQAASQVLMRSSIPRAGSGGFAGAEDRGQLDERVRELIRYFRAALVTTADASGIEPRYSITRAYRFMTGQRESADGGKGTQLAAGFVKRLLKLRKELGEEIVSDPVLRAALEAAERSKPAAKQVAPGSKR